MCLKFRFYLASCILLNLGALSACNPGLPDPKLLLNFPAPTPPILEKEKLKSARPDSHCTVALTPSKSLSSAAPGRNPVVMGEDGKKKKEKRSWSLDPAQDAEAPPPDHSPPRQPRTSRPGRAGHAPGRAGRPRRPRPSRADSAPGTQGSAPLRRPRLRLRPCWFDLQPQEAEAAAPPPPRGSGFDPGSPGPRDMELRAADREPPARPASSTWLAPGPGEGAVES